MLAILYYCLKVIICSGLLYGYYLLVLRNNRFHQWNRFYLLAAIIISFALPFIKIQLPFFSDNEEPVIQSLSVLSAADFYFSKLHQHSFDFTWPMMLGVLYTCIVFFLITLFIRNVVKVQLLKKLYPYENLNGIHFYNTSEPGTPFSFFKNIFWNSNISLNNEKGQQMLRHELTHIQEKHSTDKVALEILIAFAWWNPFLYYIRKELAVIHEFIADKKASAGDDHLQYASLLLMKAMGSEQYILGNPFFHTQLKRRLTMLTTNKNPRLSYLRRLMVLPLAVIAVVLFSFKYKQENNLKNRTAASSGRLQKQTPEEGLVVHGFYQDTTSRKITGKDQHQYKGKFIESLLTTTDGKGVVVRTTDRAVYFLNRDEAKKELDMVITDAGVIAPTWAKNMMQHKTEIVADNVSISNDNQSLHFNNGSVQIRKSGIGLDDFDKALVIVDGVRLDAAKMKELDIRSFKNMDILKGDSAIALYGDNGKNGVIVITTKKGLPDGVLYIIDGIESTKKQADELNPNTIKSIDVLKGEPATKPYGSKGENGVIIITTKGKEIVSAPVSADKLQEVTVTGYASKEGVATAAQTQQKEKLSEVTIIGYKTKPDIVFTKAEVEASFPGGIDGWRRYLERNLRYPEAAQKNNTQGIIKVKFIVHEDGNLTDIKAMNDPGDGLAEEAVRVIQKGPKWIPARQNGNNVTSQFVQTLTFQLQ